MDGRFEYEPSPPSLWATVYLAGCASFRQFVLFLLAICLGFLGIWWVAHRQFGPMVRWVAERHLSETLAARGLRPRIGSADFVEGQGIWLRDVAILSESGGRAPLLEIDEVLLRSDEKLWRLVSKKFLPDRILVRHLKVHAIPEADGRYALASLFPLPSAGGGKVPVSIVEATIDAGVHLGAWRLEERISHLRIDVVPIREAGPPDVDHWRYEVTGELRATRIGRMEFAGAYGERDRSWRLGGSAAGLRLSTDLLHAAGDVAGQDLSQLLKLDGWLDLEFSADGVGFEGVPNYALSGEIRDGRIDDARWPDPIVDLQGTFSASPELWEVRRATARIGQGSASLSAMRTRTENGDQWTAALQLEGLQLDERLAEVLPPKMRREWDEFRPKGVVDATMTVTGDGVRWDPALELRLRDVQLTYARFPYPIQRCTGALAWHRERLTAHLEGRASGSRVAIQVDYANPGANYTGWLEVKLLDRLAISETLFQALEVEPATHRSVREFSPQGQLEVTALFRKESPQTPVHRTYVIDLVDGSLKYAGLPYPLHGVRGRIEYVDGTISFRDIVGSNGGGVVSCNGQLSKDRFLELDFLATGLAFDEELKRALPESLETVWNQLRPQGDVDHVEAKYTKRIATGASSLKLEAQLWRGGEEDRHSVSIRPTWLPYVWSDMSGTIRYEDGHLQLDELRGSHDETTMTLRGMGRVVPGGWWLDLAPCSVDGLRPTEEVLAALPPSVSQGLRTIDLDGRLNLHGRVVVMSGLRDPSFSPPLIRRDPTSGTALTTGPLEVQWDLAVDLDRCEATIAGQRLHEAHGRLDTVGVMIDDRVECFGQFDLDSLMWRDSQVWEIQGPIFIDTERLAIGSMAPLADERSTPRPLGATWLGGRLQLDAQVGLTGAMPYMLQASLSEGRLEKFADELSPQWRDLAGAAFAGIRIEGRGTEPDSLTGHGRLQLRDAQIYELPLMVNLLKLLSIRQVDRTAFTTSNVDYRIQRDRVLLDRVELSGDAISLRGSGELDFHRRIQAQFYTRVGREEFQLPVISPLFGAASRQFLLISVDGTLDAPQVTQIPFPKINDAIQAMTAEPVPAESAWFPGDMMPPPPIPLGLNVEAPYRESGVQGARR